MSTTPQQYAQLDAWIDAHFDEQVKFLQALVQVPTDTPPGNNAPHAERTADLLKGFGYEAEKHPVPAAEVKRLLAQRPKALGLAVPGMPPSAPGMDVPGRKDPYDVLLISADGQSKVFAAYPK